MKYTSVTIDEYIKIYLTNNPTANAEELRTKLELALTEFLKETKCSCGGDLWVVGSALAGNKCFNCLVGETNQSVIYEIEEAIYKKELQEQYDEIFGEEIGGYYDDDGNKLNIDDLKTPELCLSCKFLNHPFEKIMCNLNRLDQKDSNVFVCHQYRKR